MIVVVGALSVLGYTLNSSIFYASAEDNGPRSVGVTQIEAPSTSVSQVTVAVGTSTPIITPKTEAPKIQTSPSRLIIPALKIDANVQYVGMNDKGNMGTPKGFTDVAWYEPGTTPGEPGSAVMAGHVDNAIALDGVFKHLGDLHVGDDVYVKRNDGTQVHFVVNDVETYPYQETPANLVFGQSNESHINLISCAGTWMKDLKTYDKRLVVYTTLAK